jgi:hypothetical protein
MGEYKPLKIKKTGVYRCTICDGCGTAQAVHCGKLMKFEEPDK